eukprot:792508_1
MKAIRRILHHTNGALLRRNKRLFGCMQMERIKQIQNGSKVQGVFSEHEMKRRLSNAHKIMEDDHIDYALFTSYHNICYLTQFVYCSFGRKYALIVDRNNESETNLIASNIDGGYPFRKSAKHCHVSLYTDWNKDNYHFAIEQILKQHPFQKSFKIGIEFDDMTLQSLQQIKDYFINYTLEFVDIGHQMMTSRMIKSEEEHQLIRNGAHIADLGGYAAVNAIQNGANTEHEIAMESTNCMIRGIADRYEGVDLMDTWCWFQSGINTDGAHNPTTSKKLKDGDILSMNCFPMIHGYYTALERTLFYNQIATD